MASMGYNSRSFWTQVNSIIWKAEAFRFVSDVVYTNIMSAGAYRGYGATQGLLQLSRL